MIEIFTSMFVVVSGGLVIAATTRRLTKYEQRFVMLALAAHFLAAIAQIVIAKGVYRGGDHILYMEQGSLLARAFEIHPERFGRLWLNLLFQRETGESLIVVGEQSSTGSMTAIVAVLAFLLRYSMYGACLALTAISFMGKLALYRVFRDLLPDTLRPRILVGVFVMPSAVFWSAGLQKEAVVVASMGPLWLGAHRLLRGRLLRGGLLALVSVVPIALVKPYTLFALAVAIGVWVGFHRLRARQGGTGPVRIRPLYLLLGTAVAVGGVVLLGHLFPTYSTENLGEDIARHQRLGEMMMERAESAGDGASHYEIGTSETSLQKQLAFAPLAVATALFRPFPFEANNALAFVASLESFALTAIVLRTLLRGGLRRAFSVIMSNPVLTASLAFALLFGIGVGLVSANFGSLSRYRMPLIPFWATLVLVLAKPWATASAAAKMRHLAPARRPLSHAPRRFPAPR
jgi:hypothetical protein